MINVKLPRAEWDAIDELLEMHQKTGWLVEPLRKEIKDQVDRQEA